MAYRPIAQRAWSDDWGNTYPDRPNCTIYCGDDMPRSTGLLDETGTPLYHTPDRVPIGFQIPCRKRAD